MNQKGFTLIELVIVMVIMTILALLAGPSFRMYKSKAIQKEGFALMSAYYAQAQSSRSEFGIYPGNFVGTRFSPHGPLNYRVRIEDNPNSNAAIVDPSAIQPLDNDPGCIATWSDCDCDGTGCNKYERHWTENPAGIIGSRIGPQTVLLNCPPLAVAGATDNTFSVRVAAVISTTTMHIDRYGMDETKQIIACEDGLK